MPRGEEQRSAGIPTAGDAGDLWVFGYGSLIWSPGFPFIESRLARLPGRQRALCIYSVRYRGSSERPGLVFGLDFGGTCDGMAFRVAAESSTAVERYLREREQVTGVYRSEVRPVTLLGREPESVRALTFIAHRGHRQYAGRLQLAEEARIVLGSRGVSGRNLDYVLSTARHLKELGIRDRHLERLVTLLGGLNQGRASISRSKALPLRRAYPHGLTPRLPPDQALRCNHRMNLGM
mgnify:CR=1 FL=1